MLESFPVLPALIRESHGGSGLNELYEDILNASENADTIAIHKLYEDCCCMLAPIIVAASDWRLRDASVLGRGLALVPKA